MDFAYIVKDSVPCFVCHMTEKIFFLYLTGFQNFQGTVCGSFGMFFQYHCPDSSQRTVDVMEPHTEYAAIRFKKPKEQFAAAHRGELDAYNAAVRYFKVHLEGTKYSTKKLNEERTQLAGEVAEYRERLSAVQEDVKILRDVRHWLNQVLPSEQYRQTAEPGKKPSIQQAVKGRAQRIREEQGEKRQQPRTEKKQDMEL